jgi:hypothetical protein
MSWVLNVVYGIAFKTDLEVNLSQVSGHGSNGLTQVRLVDLCQPIFYKHIKKTLVWKKIEKRGQRILNRFLCLIGLGVNLIFNWIIPGQSFYFCWNSTRLRLRSFRSRVKLLDRDCYFYCRFFRFIDFFPDYIFWHLIYWGVDFSVFLCMILQF